ncbi:MAG: DUF2723 domain-containing protein [Phycisphaerae bacterium]|nr:DUF2723 domain-containing protein [Phycisphaerae bacterium]
MAGLIALAVYIVTLAPTVTSEDSGEFIGAAALWGVAHPPGYPLWIILAGIFLRIVPIGNIAWRCNLFSAVCAAVSIVFFCRSLKLIGIRPLAAFTAVLVLAFGRIMWSQSVITEVYALHILIVALIIWAGIAFDQSQQRRYLIIACLLLGLGMSNHQTIGFTGVAVATWILLRNPRLFTQWRLVVITTIAFVVGLFPHVYLLARAKANPPVNWGNPQTISALWDHVSRRQYKSINAETSELDSPWIEHRMGELRLIGQYCAREYTPVILIAALPGAFVLCTRRFRRFASLWALLVICHVAIHMAATNFAFDSRTEIWCNQVFFIPLYTYIAMLLAFSLHAAYGWLKKLNKFGQISLTALLTVAIPATPLIANWSFNNMRHYYYAEDHARNILDSMLPNAIIFPSGDHNTFPLIYKVLVEKYRPDVIIADKYGYIDLDLYRDMPNNPGKPRTLADRDRIEGWVIQHAKRPVYYTVNRPSLIPNTNMVQVGILYHLLPIGYTIDEQAPWSIIRYRNLDGLDAPRDLGADNILADYTFFQGLRELHLGSKTNALEYFNECSQKYAVGIKEIFNNIGCAWADSGNSEDAIAFYRQAADLDTRYAAPRWSLTRLYKQLHQYDRAEQVFFELSRIDPKDFRVWGELGFLAARDNRYDLALKHWRHSLTLNPVQPQIIEQLYHHHFPISTNSPATTTNATTTNQESP